MSAQRELGSTASFPARDVFHNVIGLRCYSRNVEKIDLGVDENFYKFMLIFLLSDLLKLL